VVKKTGIVMKANVLVEASYRLDLIEQRLILAAIVEARESQRGLTEHDYATITAQSFAITFGMEEGNVYRQLKEAVDSLFNRYVIYGDTDPVTGLYRRNKVRWISKASYIDGAGTVQFRFTPEVAPLITRLERRFTSYQLEQIAPMSSAHAIRMFELLAQYLDLGERQFTLVELRAILGIEGQYPSIYDLKRWVVDVAVDQINTHSDIRISYENIKVGRSVVGLLFKIEGSNQEKKAKKTRQPSLTNAYIDAQKLALPGETYDQVRARIRAQRAKKA